MASQTNDQLKIAYTKAVRTGVLNLQQKDIKQLPIGVFTLHEFVPDENGWWELLVPHTLILTHNELTDISAPNNMNWYNAWKELQTLNISYNQIRDIPIEILQLESLRKLILHHNKLRQLPLIPNFTQNLTNIELQNNKLVTLDENIGSCKKLQHLNVSYNSLKFLPKSLSNCVELQTFEATNNNIPLSLTFTLQSRI